MPRLSERYRLSDNGRSGLEAAEGPRVRVLAIHLVVAVLAAVDGAFAVRALGGRGDVLRGFSSLPAADFGVVCVRVRRGPLSFRLAEADRFGIEGRATARGSMESMAMRSGTSD